MNRKSHALRMMRRLLGGLLIATLMPVMAIADEPIASSSFVGAENPLSENGAWVPITSLSPNGSRLQKNNGAYPNQPWSDSGARTTAVVPADHYSEIVVGHVGSNDYVGPNVRVQASGPSIDSQYLWWASPTGTGDGFYRIEVSGTGYNEYKDATTSHVVDGDRLRLIARGRVIYGIKNGVRDFIYNAGPDKTTYFTGTTGILAYAGESLVTNAMIASWSTGPAPVSSGTWASSTFAGTENPLDEGDRWYPLPGYLGFQKTGGAARALDATMSVTGAWSITPPPKQYSEVTLGAVASGRGGPVVRIDRNNHTGQTGWLLLLNADSPSFSGIYKLTPPFGFNLAHAFTPAIISGDKWGLTADGNTLEVFRNGVSQFMYTTDGSYANGDVGIMAYTSAFTFTGWEGGDPAGRPGTSPTITGFTPTSGPALTSVTISGTNFIGATAAAFNGSAASFTVTSATAIQATVPRGATTGLLSVTTPGGTATSPTSFTVKVPLTVTKTGLIGGGTVTSSPSGVDCRPGCSATSALFDIGSTVTLTAVPAFGSVFTGWGGCDTVSGTTCTVTVSGDRAVTAGFLGLPPLL